MTTDAPQGDEILVFQYGSNSDQTRLNSSDRLDGAAQLFGLAETVDRYHLAFNVWSSGQRCGVANLMPGDHTIYGALYAIPDYRVLRHLKRPGIRTLDQIEGEGQTYTRLSIALKFKGALTDAVTYFGRSPNVAEYKTTCGYAQHIVRGLEAIGAPARYLEYINRVIVESLALTA